jgi:hypothetical protein
MLSPYPTELEPHHVIDKGLGIGRGCPSEGTVSSSGFRFSAPLVNKSPRTRFLASNSLHCALFFCVLKIDPASVLS